MKDLPPRNHQGDSSASRVEREARRAAALRANLQRRKSQLRARDEDAAKSPAEDGSA